LSGTELVTVEMNANKLNTLNAEDSGNGQHVWCP